MKPNELPAAKIDACMLGDQDPLRRRLCNIKKAKAGEVRTALLKTLADAVEQSIARRQRRQDHLPVPAFPEQLPVAERREEIAALIAQNQVVVICGETGSGKSTQLPKICLSLGRGVAGMIGHTQPRRIAARAIASRLAAELKTDLGHAVGYQVRFNERLSPDTHIKVMTDGILLAEIQGDRLLSQYDTLIIDEAHERGLNIDFLLGYMKRLLAKRADLKLIITSATIDPARFSQFFAGAPIMEVSGRTYPVEVRYRPPVSTDDARQDQDRLQAILDAVDEAAAAGSGDILVFLCGERDIRETAGALRKHHPPHTEILPLYARLSAAEQDRVFKPHRGRRIVLATNVAETSLTVPGIHYVIDPGYARISRYSHGSKVQRLPIEKISQASADQRKGRCGRIASGICIRLYAEDDYLARPEYTEPEVLRASLAGVILRMQALGLGEVERFPFLDPPASKMINDGFKLLHELGAVDERRSLTATGKQLARFPVDPRIGRMLLAAAEQNCLREVLIIAAALSVPDPRERPINRREAADEKHRQFQDERSDFLSFLKLWEVYQEQAKHLSQNKLRRFCRDNFLAFMRMREWNDIHQQLHSLAREMGLRPDRQHAEYEPIHRALLAGLLGNIGVKLEQNEYQSTRGRKLAIFPGSALHKKKPKWIMAAELIETGRIYAATVAAVAPAWIEQAAGHLVRRSYEDPRWEKKRSQVVAREQVKLYGLVIVSHRKVPYGPIDPKVAREIFIHSALVAGDYSTDAKFFRVNRDLIAAVEALEHKSRRRDVLVDEETLFAFYDERIPSDIDNGAGFERWRKEKEREDPRHLFLNREYLMRHAAKDMTADNYPDHLKIEGMQLALSYRFEPGHPEDGITVTVPLAALNQLTSYHVDRLVPGLLREKIIALIKSLPKSLRRHFVPASTFADACMDAIASDDRPLPRALAARLGELTGIALPDESLREEALADHLRMNIKVIDSRGELLAMSKNLSELQAQLGESAQESFRAHYKSNLERDGITSWDFGDLPEQVRVERHGTFLAAYPALVDKEDAVAIRLFDSQDKAAATMRAGLRRLFILQLPQQVKYLQKNLPGIQRMCLHYAAVGTCAQLKHDLVIAVTDRTFIDGAPAIRSQQDFESHKQLVKQRLMITANELCELVGRILAAYHSVANAVNEVISPATDAAIADIEEQLKRLVYPGFVTLTPEQWLRHTPRYLKAVRARLEKLINEPAKDIQKAGDLAPLWRAYRERAEQYKKSGVHNPELEQYRWMLEEFRVSLFAQELGTAFPISRKRLDKQWGKIKS